MTTWNYMYDVVKRKCLTRSNVAIKKQKRRYKSPQRASDRHKLYVKEHTY